MRTAQKFPLATGAKDGKFEYVTVIGYPLNNFPFSPSLKAYTMPSKINNVTTWRVYDQKSGLTLNGDRAFTNEDDAVADVIAAINPIGIEEFVKQIAESVKMLSAKDTPSEKKVVEPTIKPDKTPTIKK